MDFVAPAVIFTKLGQRIMTFINANNAIIGSRLLLVLSFKILASHCACGSEQFDILRVKSMVSVPWDFKEFWGRVAIGQPGPGCTN